MSKENIYSPWYKPFFRETFNDEFTLRKNGGDPTDVTFNNGECNFNGNSSKVNYNLGLHGTYSVRIRCNPTNFDAIMYLFDSRGSNGDGVGTINTEVTTGNLILSSGTSYINGIINDTVTADEDVEIVITGMTLKQGTGDNLILIGCRYANSLYFWGDIDLVEIYRGTLTAEEVKLLHDNKYYIPLPSEGDNYTTLLDYTSQRGVVEDLSGLNTLTSTDVSVCKQGDFYSAKFNGSTSKIDCGSDFIGTKAVTIMGWIKPYTDGEGSLGRIIDNGVFRLYYVELDSRIILLSGGSSASSANNIIDLNKHNFICVTQDSDGVVNFYIGDKDNAPTLSGTADQNNGTSISGIYNVIIGNNAGQTRTIDGLIPQLTVKQNILSLNQITQYWSSTKGDMN